MTWDSETVLKRAILGSQLDPNHRAARETIDVPVRRTEGRHGRGSVAQLHHQFRTAAPGGARCAYLQALPYFDRLDYARARHAVEADAGRLHMPFNLRHRLFCGARTRADLGFAADRGRLPRFPRGRRRAAVRGVTETARATAD